MVFENVNRTAKAVNTHGAGRRRKSIVACAPAGDDGLVEGEARPLRVRCCSNQTPLQQYSQLSVEKECMAARLVQGDEEDRFESC